MLWQKKLELSYSSEVLDIVQFGSSITNENTPNDIDIAVIFKFGALKEQLNYSQEIKRQLEKETDLPIHIKSFDLYSLFDPSNFAKESILFYGKSLQEHDYFAKRFGLLPRVHITYSLEKLEKKDKVRFHYMLKGKKGRYGMLKKYNGRLLNPGLIEIFPEYEKLFLEAIKAITTEFSMAKIFVIE